MGKTPGEVNIITFRYFIQMFLNNRESNLGTVSISVTLVRRVGGMVVKVPQPWETTKESKWL